MPDAERATKRLQALAESAEMFADASTELTRLLELVARRFSELVGEAVNIRLIEGDDLVPVATYCDDPAICDYLRQYHDATPLKVGQGISGEVLRTGEPYFEPVLDLVELKKRIAPAFFHHFEKIGITGMIVVRLRARGINLGYLSLFRISKARPPYTTEELALVRDLADRAALAIDNSRILDSLERRVEERTAELEAANRELEAFSFSVSHDLRAPLRAIDGFAQALVEDHGQQLDDAAKQKVATIQRNAQRAGKLIDDLLRLARFGRSAIEPVVEIDMRALAESVLEGIRAENPKLTFQIDLGELPAGLGNSDLLRQVWQNLLDNAVKYSRKRDVVRIAIRGERSDGEVRYTVEDHGAGFDPKYGAKLFGVFQRLHKSSDFEGTGVGLALVHRIVTRHGGRVWAEGRLDAGATFGFSLPERRRSQG